jgi:hypothetical protein
VSKIEFGLGLSDKIGRGYDQDRCPALENSLLRMSYGQQKTKQKVQRGYPGVPLKIPAEPRKARSPKLLFDKIFQLERVRSTGVE